MIDITHSVSPLMAIRCLFDLLLDPNLSVDASAVSSSMSSHTSRYSIISNQTNQVKCNLKGRERTHYFHRTRNARSFGTIQDHTSDASIENIVI